MATDKSPPKVGLILKVAVFSVATLVGVHAALVAYFDSIARAEEHRKVGEVAPQELLNVRADEKDRLNSGPTPIDRVMQQMAARGRTTVSPEVTPTVSKDLAPLQGWVKMPGQIPPEMTTTQPAHSASASPWIDAGAAAALDGAVPKAAKSERARPDGGPGAKPPAKAP